MTPVYKPFSAMTETERENTYRAVERQRHQHSLACAILALGLICGFMANVLAHFGK
jgi:hypothetical protein